MIREETAEGLPFDDKGSPGVENEAPAHRLTSGADSDKDLADHRAGKPAQPSPCPCRSGHSCPAHSDEAGTDGLGENQLGSSGRQGWESPDQPAQATSSPENTGATLGIRLRKSGQVFFCPAPEEELKVGAKVLIRQEQGLSLGEVVSIAGPGQEKRAASKDFHGKILGPATAQDIAQHTENSLLAAEAAAFCKTCIRQRELDMKLVDVEVLHDRSKIIFFFTAPARIDFRELVKDLVRNYRTRIELRQIGVRHETQMVGGLGNCGSVCCCHRYLRKFAPVTIKMAKEQNLFLNPAKLSGMCGRLLCCLSFEQANYESFNRRAPKLGKKYSTSAGNFKILRANMFRQSIVCLSPANEEVEFSLEEWETMQPKRIEQGSAEGREREAAQDKAAGSAEASSSARQVSADSEMEHPSRSRSGEPGRSMGRGRKKRKPGQNFSSRPREDGNPSGKADGPFPGKKPDPSSQG